jgi:hypothetical protein
MSEATQCELVKPVDLVLYAIRMDDTRFRPAEEELLQDLLKCGIDFWNKSLVVLSFANRVGSVNSKNREEKSKAILMMKHEQWKKRALSVLLVSTVSSEYKLPNEVLNHIPFAPVGHHTEPKLFDKLWMSDLVKCMLVRMGESEAGGGLWKALKGHVDRREDEPTIQCEYT